MKNLVLLIALLSLVWQATAQVSINDDNSAPDPSAMLDVRSSDKGFLPPRMTTAQMNGIVAPVAGLLVYNTSVNALYWYDGTHWQQFNEFNFVEQDPVFALHPASSITNDLVNDWNTAYGWGNHALAGYLTSYTETDPIFGTHPAFGITQPHIDQWNTAYSWGNHALAGYLTSYTETDPLFYAHPASWISTGDINNWNQAYANRLVSVHGSTPLSLQLQNNQLTGSIQPASAVQSGYLTANDWNTFNNKQSQLTFGHVTSPDMVVTGGNNAVYGNGLNLTINKGNLSETYSSVLTITGGANAVLGTGTTIRVNQATSSQSGYLSSADWNTFNNKQNALTFGNLTSSDITVTGGSSAVKGSGTTLSVKKGNLIESGSSVLSITNGSNAVLGTSGTSLQVKQAGALQSGYLSSGDWNSFNDKVSSQWTSNGTKLHYNTGNVGIGTSDPQSKVSIAGNASIGSSYSSNTNAPENGLLVEGQVGVGTSNPIASAALEVKSVSQGFLPPRMTMAQRDAIASPVDGLIIICTDCGNLGNLQMYFNNTWNPLAFNRYPMANNVTQTGNPEVNYTLTGSYQYLDVDNDPEGATIFKWYRADDASGLNETVISGATSTTYALVEDDTTKYIRFSATPGAQSGASPGSEIKAATFIGPITLWLCGTSTLTINHVSSGGVAPVNKITTYGTVTNIPGEPSKCWITSNLGSDHQATAVNDVTEASAGWYWQFNRKQGYKHDGSTRTPNTTWITSIIENTDWLTTNDPCNLELGAAWRLPTYTEWNSVNNTGGWTNWNGPWGTGLNLHANGYLDYSSGSLAGRGSYGHCWSSTQYSTGNGWYLFFYSSYSGMSNYGYKAGGLGVRCLREN